MKLDEEVEVSGLEDLEFEIPCDSVMHASMHKKNESASWILTGQCPCGNVNQNFRCTEGVEQIMTAPTVIDTPGCGMPKPTRDWVIRVDPLRADK